VAGSSSATFRYISLKEAFGMAQPRVTLTQLAQQAAAQIGFLPRRWWRETVESQVLRVEVERSMVGAPPAIAVLTVPIPHALPAPHPRPARTAYVPSPHSATRTRERIGMQRAAEAESPQNTVRRKEPLVPPQRKRKT